MSRSLPHVPRSRNRTHPKTSSTPGQFGLSKKSPETKVAFLAVLATPLGNPTKASRAIGIDRRTAYNWKNSDKDFSDAWDAACEEGVDLLEEEARRRGHDGITVPIFNKDGDQVGERKEYSDTLLGLVLKGRRSKVFRDKLEHSGPDGGAIQHEVTVKFVTAGKAK